MRIIFLYLFSLVCLSYSYGQNNALVLKDNPYIVLNGGSQATPIYLVVNQNNASGIVTQGSGGNIISEDEYNYVKWMIGTSTGSYTVPFTTGVGGTEQKIPLGLSPTTAGVGTGHILFSTYETDDNNLPWPTGVAHLQTSNGNFNNKDWVVDRFWIIDAVGYSTKPAVALTFDFNNDATEVGAPNLLNPNNLGAQRYNPNNNFWEASHSGSNGIWGTSNGSIVSGVNAPSTGFYRVWTLTDYSHPLPLQFNFFTANCNAGNVVLEWETADVSVTHYVVQRSTDGINFSDIGTLYSGISSVNKFTFVDRFPQQSTAYYRLVNRENGEGNAYSSILVVEACAKEWSNYVYSPIQSKTIHVEINTSSRGEAYTMLVVDLSGKVVINKTINISNKGVSQFVFDASHLAKGIYNVALINQFGEKEVTKIVL